MAIQSIRDVFEAYDSGRVHIQSFYKAAGVAGDGYWQDWAYSAGKPAVNARVGDSATLTPFVAVNNQAIHFPSILAGQERRVAELTVMTTAGGASQASTALILYDLLAVYPLLDGDSIDPQVMDNTLSLPRYSSGAGVVPVLVNHVAAQTSTATGEYTYVSCNGSEKTVQFGVTLAGINKACAAPSTAGVGTVGNFALPRGDGCGGVRQVNSLTFYTAPGGLFALYLLRPLLTINNNDGFGLAGSKCATEKLAMTMNACQLPVVYDGAHLGFFYQAAGGARTVGIAGTATFVWG
jgi:hypothetical protein